MKALCAIRDKDPSRKSLVVSQFTSFLDIVEDALKEQDFLFVRLDGRMTQEARARAIETFSDPSSSSPTVFLLSLTAGGVGLNLTAATRVFLLDPVGFLRPHSNRTGRIFADRLKIHVFWCSVHIQPP